jgi:hypothetical protein
VFDYERWVTVYKAEGCNLRIGVENGRYLIRAGQSGGWFQLNTDKAGMAQKLADICHFFGIKATIEGVSGAPIEPLDLEKR